MNTQTQTPKPIAIFRAGTHTAMSGATLSFAAADLHAMASHYDADKHEAPLVVGHPATDAPAYGWVRGLFLKGDTLYAEPHEVDAAFAELVNGGKFKKVSAAFYAPDSPNNPVPGAYYLRHVGFLGAQPPAVKGLRRPEFSEQDDVIFFEEQALTAPELNPEPIGDPMAATTEDSKAAEIAAKEAELIRQQDELAGEKAALAAQQAAFSEQQAALQKEQAKAKAERLDALVGELVREGRILPKDKNGLIAYMSADRPNETLEFAENGEVVKKPLGEWFEGFLRTLPKQVEFGEMASSKPPEKTNDAEVARRARSYKAKMDADGNNISFAEAVDAVNAGRDK